MKIKAQTQLRKGYDKPYYIRYQHLNGVLIYTFRKKILELYYLTRDKIIDLNYHSITKRIKIRKP